MGNKQQIQNVELLMARQKYLKRFEQLLIDLPSFSINGYFKQIVQRFRSCLLPDEAQNESRLPFFSNSSFSRKPDKDRCVLCVFSYVIQRYWKLYNGNLNFECSINNYLTYLENYVKDGPKAYKVAGKFPEFYLEKI